MPRQSKHQFWSGTVAVGMWVGGDKKSHYLFVIFRKLTGHRRNTDYSSALIYNSVVCAAKEIKTYNKSSHMHPFPGQPRKPSHPCNAAVLSS